VVEGWLEIAGHGRGKWGRFGALLGRRGDCPGERVARGAGRHLVVCRRGVLAEVSEPPSLPFDRSKTRRSLNTRVIFCGVGLWWEGAGMSGFPCLVRSVSGLGEVRYSPGDRLVDWYLVYVAGRARPNTLRAAAFDLKAFFTVLAGKDPVEVAAADVFEFLAHQRGDRSVVGWRTGSPGCRRGRSPGGCRRWRGCMRTWWRGVTRRCGPTRCCGACRRGSRAGRGRRGW
jgi:hypothetical protein